MVMANQKLKKEAAKHPVDEKKSATASVAVLSLPQYDVCFVRVYYYQTWTVCPYITKGLLRNTHVPPLLVTKAVKTPSIVNVN